MANVLLENTNVFELKPEYQVEALRKRFGAEQNALKGSYNSNVVEKHRIQGAYEDFVNQDKFLPGAADIIMDRLEKLRAVFEKVLK